MSRFEDMALSNRLRVTNGRAVSKRVPGGTHRGNGRQRIRVHKRLLLGVVLRVRSLGIGTAQHLLLQSREDAVGSTLRLLQRGTSRSGARFEMLNLGF